MPPTGRKRPPSSPPRAAKRSSKEAKKKSTIQKPLSTFGVSLTKRPQFSKGTKLLLDDSIYDDEVPSEVEGHLFVYEISEVCQDGKSVMIVFKNQVIKEGGNRFRVFQEGDEEQVRL
jgi:hypothetical protein